jgi:GNAT superfamily N-acetyltransferase
MPVIAPRYTAAGCFAESMGFEHITQLDTTNMVVSLNSQDFNTEQIESDWRKKDITFKRADYNDQNAVREFMRKYFPVWEAEVKNTFNSLPISIHLALKDEKIVAFSAHNANNFGTGWFGPMGTIEEYRGQGLGAVLLKRCLQDIKEWKLNEAIIPWVRPIRFYAREVNAVIDRVFWQFEKAL